MISRRGKNKGGQIFRVRSSAGKNNKAETNFQNEIDYQENKKQGATRVEYDKQELSCRMKKQTIFLQQSNQEKASLGY